MMSVIRYHPRSKLLRDWPVLHVLLIQVTDYRGRTFPKRSDAGSSVLFAQRSLT